jgi:hypothetical protein
MAKLFEVTAVRNNNLLYDPTSTLYLNVNNVDEAASVVYTDAAGATATGTRITYTGYDKTFEAQIIATEAASTINTRMNAANTTDVHRLDLTRIADGAPATGYIAQEYKAVRGDNAQDIWLVMPHPLNNANAMVMIQDPTRDFMESIRTEEAASSIAASANA